MSDTFQRLRTALADRYALEREIGAGGMATVYLARDLRHRRPVALKVVRPGLGLPLMLERFLREIEVAARLQHPHILPVFDSGVVQDGAGEPVPYFVMPYVEGESLRHRLRRDGKVPPEEAAALAGEVADALAYAHAQGVIHRDIKPENILLSGGHAVVADFGVAKAIASGTAPESPEGDNAKLTAVGLAIGTPHYMSPEQATGRDVVDARADQYSLGCVLYEMLVGRPPFTGESAHSVVAQAMTAVRPRPPEFDEVVVRAMAADPAERYPDMAAFAGALRRRAVPAGRGFPRWMPVAGAVALVAAIAAAWAGARREAGTVMAGAETMAVLPFNTSGPGVEFLGEGMVDLLATNLNGVGGITTVDPRTVVRRWGEERGGAGGAVERALAVGRDLDAGSVVLGSAVSAGGQVRLAADLYSVAGDALGRARVDGPVDSVLPLVDRLSLALLRDVWRSREPLPSLQLAAVTTDSLGALRAYLEGERYYRRLSFDSALAAYTRAVEVDSTFALAHLRRALVFGWTGGYGSKESGEAAAAAYRFARRLPARDRRLLDDYRIFERGKPASVDSIRAFVAEYPADVEGRYLLGEALYHTRAFTGVSPDTIVAAFDTVLRMDASLVPAALHPIELGLMRNDGVRFRRYLDLIEPTAPPERLRALDAAAALVWGPPLPDSSLLASLRVHHSWLMHAAHAGYYREDAGSDTVLRVFRRVGSFEGVPGDFRRNALNALGYALAGMGRMREARAVAESLGRTAPDRAAGIVGWSTALGLLPISATTPFLDSVQSASPRDPERQYIMALGAVLRGRTAEARRMIGEILAAEDSTALRPRLRGLLVATEGWAALVEGDSAAGIDRLREGLAGAAAPGAEDETVFHRFQLALALAGRDATREEGIRRLRDGFDLQPLYVPLAFLALGRAWEAAGQADSAAFAYGSFLRLWDKADPELRGRVAEAREALRRLTAEPRRP